MLPLWLAKALYPAFTLSWGAYVPPASNVAGCGTMSFIQSGALNAYVEFVDTGSNSWTSGNKALFQTALGGMWPSYLQSLLAQYDSRFATTTMTVAAVCEHTITTTPIGCGNVDFSACTGVAGWNASDPLGLYFYLPADSTITCDVGCGGKHCGSTILAFQATGLGNPSPNGNAPLDAQIGASVHEAGEDVLDPNGVSGWHCPTIAVGGGTEPFDLCENAWGGGPWGGNVGGQPYTVTISSSHFVFDPPWLPGIINGCYSQVPDTSLVGAFVAGPNAASKCLGANGFQLALSASGSYCAIPTCTDGQQDGFETDTDCGGNCVNYQILGALKPANAGLCLSGKKCQYFTDCQSGTCNSGRCQ